MKTYEHPALEQVELSAVMHALSDPCRIAIVRALLEKPNLACNELPSDVSKATLSHHMEVLRGAGLIETRVVGAKCLSSVRQVEVDNQFPGILALVERD
ncbi:ArsR/SmtB family transcription factor [Cerasicoccus fimbriatus]|uniref:ArsR/SmtB family transcription factor n=1 Tax=Cerasicoccus fimbriatus TaxID=3014554 RepID=UPI0022B4A8CB|nr:helix-turn-helix domain-containing protein [Cerasicoccus sp. TK19100]